MQTFSTVGVVTGRARAVARSAGETMRALAILRARGLFDPLRLDHALAAARAVSVLGPVAGAISHGAVRQPSGTAIIDEAGGLTYRDLDRRSNALARGLAARGVGAGSVVALLARDHRGLVLAVAAVAKVGARLVLMNTGFATPQFADVADREAVRLVMYDEEFDAILSGLPAGIDRILTRAEGLPSRPTIDGLIAENSDAPLPRPARAGGLVLLTSGTTGTPKGAPRDRVSLLQSAAFLDRIPLSRNQTMVMVAPIFHGTGLSQFILGLALGGTVVLHRRFDAEKTLASVAANRAHTLVLVPTMLQRIVDLGPEVLARYDTSSLRIIFSAGSALPTDLCLRATAHFGDVLHNLYGSTEVAVALVATPQDLAAAPGTVGRPPVGCRVALIDDHGAVIDEPGVVGRIFVRSALSFGGYTDGRNKEIVDGMLSSGDVGHVDSDGLWFVDGRDDDMIVSGGENVYPIEVEDLLSRHRDITEAAVVGVDDPEFGKRLRAYVVATGALDADGVRTYVRDNLARYKVPRDVVFVEALPRNPTGKVVRRDLADLTDVRDR
jgi:fatty-acyl-CoA synthase